MDTSTVTVIPARCGLGKSTAIQALMSYFTLYDQYQYRYQDSIGLVVVTDALDRLKDYQEDAKHLQSLWGSETYNSHKKYCYYLSSEDDVPIMKKLITSKYKPIVLLTTQRYFMMSDEQREMLFTYELGKGSNKKAFKREIVIFDEKPYFFGVKNITVKNLNDVSSALQQGIPRQQPDKDWILKEYWTYREKMENILREKEKIKENIDRFYWKDQYTQNLTSNDQKFFELIDEYKSGICQEYPDALTDLKAFKRLMVDGGFFITQKQHQGTDYRTFFQLYQDNRDKFFLGQDKAKFFVFDATADIDPDYCCNYINLIDCSHHNVDINMFINQSDVNSSKSTIANQNDKRLLSAMQKVISKQSRNGFGSILVATYGKIENDFKMSNVKTGHFGGLKGTNQYLELYRMAHIGLNRFDDFEYFIKYISQKPEILMQLKSMDEVESRKFIKSIIKLDRGLFVNPDMNNIMFESIMADFEQNIFRTAIRSYQNDKPVFVFTYWNCNTYSRLNQLISERYLPYGVEIEFCGVPDEVLQMKTETRKPSNGKVKTNPQKIIDWYSKQLKGREFKVAEILKETGINNNSLKRIRKTNNVVSDLFEKAKTEKQGYYKVS